MSRLHVSDATVRFGATVALDACSISVEPGELLVVLGPSGCGKSTLLRAIAGLAPLDTGRVTIDDREVTSLPPAARDVSMVFQGYALFPHLDVERNIGFGLRARKVADAEIASSVAEIASALGIDDLLTRRPHQLSGGERQRVALARALVRAPALALLDEPLASLDAPLRVAARSEIARLQRMRGTTMLHVTHDQAEAMALGDRIAIMRGGRVVQIGTPTEIYEHPASTFVASFVGNPPMNLLPEGADTLGIRPEDVRLGAEGAAARIERIERMGDHTLLAVRIDDGNTILARAARDVSLSVGDLTHVRWDRALRFDANGEALR